MFRVIKPVACLGQSREPLRIAVPPPDVWSEHVIDSPPLKTVFKGRYSVREG
jgi:hypothetical protein